ncbi:hypothetical protein ACFVWR_04750 [Leifsonia sp. NPDC058292]|uniref:hypothetical protein n=1 Tax=Leifsonia sp. NPDC058292 TaxID=3346428 RepID=UPI0036DB7A91
MHPLTLWLTSIAELGERERERELMRRQREGSPEQLTPLQRDGRWAAAMHRWAEQSRTGVAAPVETAPAPAKAAAPVARLGCA